MIDNLYVRYSKLKAKPLDPSYRPENAIRGRLTFNVPGSEKLAVIFPGWHTHRFPVTKLAKRLNKKGWDVIIYDFHDQILVPDENTVTKSFRHIQSEIVADLQNQIDKGSYRHLHLIGISLGNVPLALVADKFPHFHDATIVVGGDDLAVDMWYGLRTYDYQLAFQKMHVGIRRLDKEWYGLAPANHVHHFKGRSVLFIMSLTDKFIRTKYQKRLAERLKEAGAELKIKRTYLGHTVTIIKYCLLGPLP